MVLSTTSACLAAGDLPPGPLAKKRERTGTGGSAPSQMQRSVARPGFPCSGASPDAKIRMNTPERTLVCTAFMVQQELHKGKAFPDVDSMLKFAVTNRRILWLSQEHLSEPPTAQPPKLFVSDWSKVPEGSVLDMAYKTYVQITGLENWLPLHECLGLEVFNSFIMLNGESPHVQACFDAAEQEHTIRIKLEKKKAAERRMKAKMAREDKLAVHDLVLQVRSGDANASVVPEASPTSLSSSFAALEDCACQQSCGPPLKKPRLTRSTLIPPQLEAAAKNMTDLGTQEVHLYEQLVYTWRGPTEVVKQLQMDSGRTRK